MFKTSFELDTKIILYVSFNSSKLLLQNFQTQNESFWCKLISYTALSIPALIWHFEKEKRYTI